MNLILPSEHPTELLKTLSMEEDALRVLPDNAPFEDEQSFSGDATGRDDEIVAINYVSDGIFVATTERNANGRLTRVTVQSGAQYVLREVQHRLFDEAGNAHRIMAIDMVAVHSKMTPKVLATLLVQWYHGTQVDWRFADAMRHITLAAEWLYERIVIKPSDRGFKKAMQFAEELYKTVDVPAPYQLGAPIPFNARAKGSHQCLLDVLERKHGENELTSALSELCAKRHH